MIETTSLELSKKLEGIVKEACSFIWAETADGWVVDSFPRYAWCKSMHPAYTACELMKVLPRGSKVKRWSNEYSCTTPFPIDSYTEKCGATPAEALGLMVVWLHGEGLLK